NQDVVQGLGIPDEAIETVTARELEELNRRARAYRGDRPPPAVRGRTIILIDDGLATGSTMRAAIAALRQQQPAQIIVAVPVASADTCAELKADVDDLVCTVTPEPFYAVGLWYEDFSQITDEETHELLVQAAQENWEETPQGQNW